jgi:hypothetical protein
MKRKNSFQWCDRCKENSTVIKIYTDSKGARKRVMLCMNNGCGYKIDLPFPEEVEQRVGTS